jgi:hypothetical protein
MSDEQTQVLMKKPQADDPDDSRPPLSDLKFQFLDVAQMHEFKNDLAQGFFEELSKTD